MKLNLTIGLVLLAILIIGVIIRKQPNDIEKLEQKAQELSGQIGEMTARRNQYNDKITKFYKIESKRNELEKQLGEVERLKSDILSNGWLVSPSHSSGNM